MSNLRFINETTITSGVSTVNIENLANKVVEIFTDVK